MDGRKSRIQMLFLCAIAVLGLFASCDDYLENVTPPTALPLDGGLETIEAMETFLLGTYGLLAGIHTERLQIVLTDLSTEDIMPIDGACNNSLQYERNDVRPTSFFVTGMWERAYEVINQCNIIIDGVNRLSARGEISQLHSDRLAGEAHLLRGVMYFELVRVFSLPLHLSDAPGLPLVLRGVDNTDEITFPFREPVAAIYTLIKDDLTASSELLLQEKGVGGRASYYAARAYLAEVAFQNEEYETGRTLAKQIIDAKAYELVEPPELYFSQKGTSEEIWSVVHTEQEGGSLYNLTRSPNCQSTVLNPDLYDRAYAKIVTELQKAELTSNGWIANDLRYSTLTVVDEIGWHTFKYASSLGANNLPAMRYAEILLMYAECQARLGETDEAITYLNKIRARAIEITDSTGNLMPDDVILFGAHDFANAEELIEAIVLERQVELVMEGNRFHDLTRLRRPVNGLEYTHDKLRWPIPQRELDANPNLVQNPGY